MDSLFRTHKDNTEEEYSVLWEKGIFIFDANVLLDLYRLPETAQKDLLDILSDQKINQRIWLPFQVSLEFIYNKIEAIGDQKNKFNAVKKIVSDSIVQIETLYSELQSKLAELQLKKRHSVINPDPYVNDKLFETSRVILNKFLQELDQLDKKQPDVNDKDVIKQKVSDLFKNKIGKGLDKKELEMIYEEGELRYKDNIPPGYKDKAKDGYYVYEDKKFLRKFGDLIVWKEIIKKCINDKIEYIILITGDSKEDWWQEKRGRKISPRYELLNEIYYQTKTVKLFHMYDTSTFMQFSKKYLNINVKEQSIAETKDLLEFTKSANLLEGSTVILAIKQLVENEISAFPILKLRYWNGFELGQFLKVSYSDIHQILREIFSNILRYSSDQIVSVRAFKAGNYLALRFRNNIEEETYDKIDTAGVGMKIIFEIMNKYGRARVQKSTNFFRIVLYFESEFTTLNDN